MNKSLVLLFFVLYQFSFSQTDNYGKLKIEIIEAHELGYALHIPANIKEKKPLIVFIPGDGEKGIDLERVKFHGPFKYLKTHQLDSYVLAPQCLENENWDAEAIFQLILKIEKENNIDADRIYLTGLSSGGWATWSLALAHPDMFAAIVPISGYVDLNQMDIACKIAAIPARVFHGLLDDVVSVEYTKAFYKELKKCNANVTLTIFSDAGHDCWSRVYDHQEIYDWMFKQIKNK